MIQIKANERQKTKLLVEGYISTKRKRKFAQTLVLDRLNNITENINLKVRVDKTNLPVFVGCRSGSREGGTKSAPPVYKILDLPLIGWEQKDIVENKPVL